ncbi:MAG: HNH endonuclease [Clostridium perfringens]|nr:HNH endonuclease [Clostridium perfringens]
MKKFCGLCNRNLIDVKEKCCSSCKDKLSKRHSIYKKDRKDIIEQKFYSSKEWINERDIIKNLDNNLCLLCLEHRELNNMDTVHHIKELKEDWSKRFEKDNLISLCESCHQKIHRKYLMSKEEKLKTQHDLRVLIKKYRE